MIGQNNPYNIRYAKGNHWKGQIGHTRGFVDFSSRQFGIRAAAYLLCWSYRRIGIDTIEGIVRRFAPSVENDTERYINYVRNKTNISRFVHLSSIAQYALLLKAMSEFEGNSVVFEEITYCFRTFKLKLYECNK